MPAVFVQKKVLEFCSKTFFYGILHCRTMHNNNAQRRAKKWNRKAELQ